MRRVFTFVVLALLGTAVAGCEQPPGHLPLQAPPLGSLPGDEVVEVPASNGAIYQATHEGGGGLALFRDHPMWQPGDLVTVSIVQQAAASKNVSQNIDKEDSIQANVTNLFGIPLAFGHSSGGQPFNTNIQAASTNKLNGTGATAQADTVTSTVSAIVQRVRPNGDLVLKGENTVQLVGGKEYIRLAGVVRSEDIGPKNIVASTQMAEGYIEFSGDGQTYLAPQMNVLQRLFLTVSSLWPAI